MNPRLILIPLLTLMAAVNAGSALAQNKGTVNPKPLPPLANPNDPKIGAKELFGRKVLPAAMPARALGFYAHGCIAGAEGLPIDGDAWQVMRLSRNRYWGHPDMVALVKRLAAKARKEAGLDADIWLTPMPDRLLSRNEREEMSAVMMVRADRLDIDPNAWTPTHLAVIRAAAREPAVQRIFVNAAIKKALCREAKGDRRWLQKVRPMYGHDYHFHIRIKCPPGSGECESQPNPTEGEGCKPADLAYWFRDSVLHPKPPKVPPKPKPPMTMAALPPACKTVLAAPDAKPYEASSRSAGERR